MKQILTLRSKSRMLRMGRMTECTSPIRNIRLFVTFFSFLLLLLPLTAYLQPGCTDEQAFNFDAAATENDGSCLYPFTEIDMSLLADLPDLLKESSGLEWINGNLYTHIDEGPPRLYKIDPNTGTILGIVTLLGGAENVDWEDIAESENYVYLGDFGNNSGNRTDLKIYRIEKNDLSGSNALVEVIEFSYADQSNFDNENNAHNFDCEAMFFQNDSLHLFSKNWLDGKTRHYVLPAEPGTYVAKVKDSFDAVGLVTAADLGEDGVISLLGRTGPGTLFCWLLFDYPEGRIFEGHKRRIFLGDEKVKGQIEAIVFTGGGKTFVSSEEKDEIPARVYEFPTAAWTGVSVATNDLVLANPSLFTFSPNPFIEDLTIELFDPSLDYRIRVYDNLGRSVFYQEHQRLSGALLSLSLAHLTTGIYFLEIENDKTRQVKKTIKF